MRNHALGFFRRVRNSRESCRYFHHRLVAEELKPMSSWLETGKMKTIEESMPKGRSWFSLRKRSDIPSFGWALLLIGLLAQARWGWFSFTPCHGPTVWVWKLGIRTSKIAFVKRSFLPSVSPLSEGWSSCMRLELVNVRFIWERRPWQKKETRLLYLVFSKDRNSPRKESEFWLIETTLLRRGLTTMGRDLEHCWK